MFKMRIVFHFLSILICNISSAQKETNIWYFGEKAGLDFSSGNPVVLTNGKLSTLEGCATVSNSNGRLLFYTDGVSVWDSLHNIMPNGRGLKGNVSSCQSAMIVQKPGSSHIFYIFTVMAAALPDGFMYSELDMNLNSGRGDIISKNIQLTTPCCENIAATSHINGKDIWVLTHKFNSDTIYSYLVTSLGINKTPVKSTTGILVSGIVENSMGTMKLSPNGKKIACVNIVYPDSSAYAILGDFNAKTGKINNIWAFKNHYAHSAEFSAESKFLYISEFIPNQIIQYHIDVPSKELFIKSRILIDSNYEYNVGTLQLGKDGKIYMAEYRSNYLSIIHAPDSGGFKCHIQKNYLFLGGRLSLLGLPNFISSYFQKKTFEIKNGCVGNPIAVLIPDNEQLDSVKWDFGDPSSGSNNYSKKINDEFHTYKKAGIYKVKLTYCLSTKKDSLYRWISVYDTPIADFIWEIEQTGPSNFAVHLFDNSLNADNWQWMDSYKTWNGQKIDLYYTDSGTYKVLLTVSNAGGCIDTAIRNIRIFPTDNHIYIPNAFSPNGDGINDTWKIDGKKNIMELTIMNQWGEILYTQTGNRIEWDGKYMGQLLSDSSLVYWIYSKNSIVKGDNKLLKGVVNILK